jgi:hypothetical protein
MAIPPPLCRPIFAMFLTVPKIRFYDAMLPSLDVGGPLSRMSVQLSVPSEFYFIFLVVKKRVGADLHKPPAKP